MFELPLDAKVTCTDGRAGTSVAVTFNEESKQISHLVVEDTAGNQRLVPFTLATRSDGEEIWLACTESELRALPLFLVSEFIERAAQQSGDWEEEEGEWEDAIDVSSFEMSTEALGMPVAVERVPEGEWPLHRSTDIEATDDHLGTVKALLVDPENGAITHLVLQKGHLWSKKRVMVPLAAVERFEYETVYLNVDKAAADQFAGEPD